MRVRASLIGLAVLSLAAGAADAQTRLATTVSATAPGGYAGNLSVLNDGIYPPDGQYYQTDTVSNFVSGTDGAYFDFDFGGLTSIGSFNLTVDNNDDYVIAFLVGNTIVASRSVNSGDGVVSGGVETFSSSPTLNGNYLASLSLPASVQADRARIAAYNGDGRYSIGELAFFAPDAVAGVPEPATWATMIAGFGLVGGALRRRRTRVAIA